MIGRSGNAACPFIFLTLIYCIFLLLIFSPLLSSSKQPPQQQPPTKIEMNQNQQ